MTPEQLADFMRSAGFVPLVKYERVDPSFDRDMTWRYGYAYAQMYASEWSFQIDRIIVLQSHRKEGHATNALTALCEQADKESVKLKLYATNWLGADPFDLVAWYKRFGFVSTEDVYAMERKPR